MLKAAQEKDVHPAIWQMYPRSSWDDTLVTFFANISTIDAKKVSYKITKETVQIFVSQLAPKSGKHLKQIRWYESSWIA